MRSPAYYVKTAAIVVLTFFQTYFLTWIILNYVRAGNFFSLNAPFAVIVILLMVLIAWTFAISVGAWDKGMEYLVVPVPTGMAIFAVLAPVNITYAFLMLIVVSAILCYDIRKSKKLSDLLIKFEPTIILKFSTNGLLFIFSALAGVFVLVSSGGPQSFNVGKQISEIVGSSLDAAIQSQLQSALENAPSGYINQVDPSVANLLSQLGLPTDLRDPTYTNPQNLGIDTKSLVESQINNLISPYKSYVTPVMALLLFGMFQFYAFIAYLIFSITVNGIYWVAKKTSFLKTEIIQVDKEVVKF